MFLLRTNLTVARKGVVVNEEKPNSAKNIDLMIPAGRKAGRQAGSHTVAYPGIIIIVRFQLHPTR